jgi:hypothetical protein
VLKQLMGGAGPGDRAATELVDLPGIVRAADPCAEELDQPTAVGAVIRATSKLFAPEGEHGGYHLNEWAILVAWQKGHSDSLIWDFKLESLPSFKGSRQMILLELAAAIAKNRWLYVRYLKSQRQEGAPNKLVTAVLMGLSNKYVVAALHARSYTFIAFAAPSRYILNHLATRPSLYGLMECMEGAVENLADLCSRATGY